MIAKSVGKTYSLKDHESTIELPIALAEIEFRKKKYINGFKLLEQYAKKIKDGNINRYLDLIDEILIFANKQNNKIIEEEYLIEKFVYGYYIDEIELIRFFELNTGNTKELRAAELIKKIKGISGLYAFEKIAVILLSQNRLDEIIEEIKREKNKFRLLNKIVIQKFPDFNKDILSLYVKHFLQAITEAKFPYFQEQICNMAKTYLDKLPIDVRKNSLVAIKEKIIFERHAFMYFTKLYPDSF